MPLNTNKQTNYIMNYITFFLEEKQSGAFKELSECSFSKVFLFKKNQNLSNTTSLISIRLKCYKFTD